MDAKEEADKNKSNVQVEMKKDNHKLKEDKKQKQDDSNDDDSQWSDHSAGPFPELGISSKYYDLDTKIHDMLNGNRYTVREYVEVYVDADGYPTGKVKKNKSDSYTIE